MRRRPKGRDSRRWLEVMSTRRVALVLAPTLLYISRMNGDKYPARPSPQPDARQLMRRMVGKKMAKRGLRSLGPSPLEQHRSLIDRLSAADPSGENVPDSVPARDFARSAAGIARQAVDPTTPGFFDRGVPGVVKSIAQDIQRNPLENLTVKGDYEANRVGQQLSEEGSPVMGGLLQLMGAGGAAMAGIPMVGPATSTANRQISRFLEKRLARAASQGFDLSPERYMYHVTNARGPGGNAAIEAVEDRGSRGLVYFADTPEAASRASQSVGQSLFRDPSEARGLSSVARDVPLAKDVGTNIIPAVTNANVFRSGLSDMPRAFDDAVDAEVDYLRNANSFVDYSPTPKVTDLGYEGRELLGKLYDDLGLNDGREGLPRKNREDALRYLVWHASEVRHRIETPLLSGKMRTRARAQTGIPWTKIEEGRISDSLRDVLKGLGFDGTEVADEAGTSIGIFSDRIHKVRSPYAMFDPRAAASPALSAGIAGLMGVGAATKGRDDGSRQ